MTRVIVFLTFFFLLDISCHHSPINVYDNFESQHLKSIWSTDRIELHSLEFQSKIARKGKCAAKITLRTGDKMEEGNDNSLVTERDELEEADYLMSDENNFYEYQFSLFLPDSFPIVPTRLVLAQWKQKCPSHSCSDDSPVLALRYQSGKLLITLNTDSGRKRLYEMNDEIRNKWLDFRFDIRFSQTNNGEVKAYLNDKNVVDYKGVTSYTNQRGYHSTNNRYYFKMGLYRDRMPEPMWIYIDEYTKKELTENKY